MVGVDMKKAHTIFVRQDGRYDLDAQTVGAALLFQQSQDPTVTDRNIVANTAFGQAANYHDVYYWYAFDMRDRAAEAAYGLRWDQLTDAQRTSGVVVSSGLYAGKTMQQVDRLAKDALYEADLNLTKVALAWQPIDLLDQKYRQAAIEGFLFKMEGYGSDYKTRLQQDWATALQPLDPSYQRAGLLAQAGLVARANYWSYTGLEELSTLPFSRQEFGFFTRHLTSLENLEPQNYQRNGYDVSNPRPPELPPGNVLPVPHADTAIRDGQTIDVWKWEGELDQRYVVMTLEKGSRVFVEETYDTRGGTLLSRYTATPASPGDVRNKAGYFESAYNWTETNSANVVTGSGSIAKPTPSIPTPTGPTWTLIQQALNNEYQRISTTKPQLLDSVKREIDAQRQHLPGWPQGSSQYPHTDGPATLPEDVQSAVDQPVLTTPKNPRTVDVSVDTSTLKPDPSNGLGSSQGGQGTLDAGPGYTVKSPSNFVDQNGVANTALSNGVTAGTRPGNSSLNPTQGLVNALRKQVNDLTTNEVVQIPVGAKTWSFGEVYHGDSLFLDPTYGLNFYDANDRLMGFVAYKHEKIWRDAGSGHGLELLLTTERGKTYLFNDPGVPDKGVRELKSSDQTLPGLMRLPSEPDAAQLSQDKAAADQLPYTDPLVLDVNADGVDVVPAPILIETNNDGIVEPVYWSAYTDPLLVLDANHDGQIGTSTERVSLGSGSGAIYLGGLDGNGDGRIDAGDVAYAQLRIWADRDQDGYASEAERSSLTEVGIESIDVNPTHQISSVVAGRGSVNGVRATLADGSTRTLWDVPDAQKTATVTTVSHGPYVDTIMSSGQVALVARTTKGVLLNLSDIAAVQARATQAIGNLGNDTLVGTDGNDWLIGVAGTDKFQAGDGSDMLVLDADDKQADIDAGAGVDTAVVADDRGVLLNLAQANLEVVYGGYGNDVFIGGGADNYVISAAAGDDLVIGGIADDVLNGEDGVDLIEGGKGDDLIRGGRDQDQLYGGDGNDVIDGGLDDDTINAGAGNDVILVSGGNDVIDGGSGIDLIDLDAELEAFTITKNADNTYTVVDDAHGGAKLQVSNVERFSFKRGGRVTTSDFDIPAPLPVADTLAILSTDASYTIPISMIVGNDIDFQGQRKNIYWVGDAIGGKVELITAPVAPPSGGPTAPVITLIPYRRRGQPVVVTQAPPSYPDQAVAIKFTPTPGHIGPVQFSYQIEDEDHNKAPIITSTLDPSISGPMKGVVRLIEPDSPTDPDFAEQWYLSEVRAPSAWKSGYTGKGVKVLVLEPSGQFATESQAADLNHPDLAVNKSAQFKDTASHSVHATLVAGVIGAARNGIGGVGVAPDATLDSRGMLTDSYIPQYREELAAMANYDVANMSWGFTDLWSSLGSDPSTVQTNYANKAAIAAAAERGRAGLGTVMVFGAGNSRESGQDAGLSSLTNNRYAITVGAINAVGDIGAGVAPTQIFSAPGANVLVAAPGSNIRTTSSSITTPSGATVGELSKVVQGTSFATPIVSGVVALMLQANPKLSYRDVQAILALTAHKPNNTSPQSATVWSTNADLHWNGLGMHASRDFGFGVVDAAAAVRMAQEWVSLGGARNEVSEFVDGNSAAYLADGSNATLTFRMYQRLEVEHVQLQVSMSHPKWSDLRFTVQSPSGTRSFVLDRPGFVNGQIVQGNLDGSYSLNLDLSSVQFRGENSEGTWRLLVEDLVADGAALPQTSYVSAAISVSGSNQQDATNLQRYVLTDEYLGDMVVKGRANQATEINASALSRGVSIDVLSPDASRAIGYTVIIDAQATVGRVLGGAGNDTLLGGSYDEKLFGGEGDDSLDGRAGNDYLKGGVGNDTLIGGTGYDVIVAGAGANQLTGGADRDFYVFDGDALSVSTNTITDFSASGREKIVIVSPNMSFSDLVIQSDGEGGSMIRMPGGSSIRVLGTAPGLLNSTNCEIIPDVSGLSAAGVKLLQVVNKGVEFSSHAQLLHPDPSWMRGVYVSPGIDVSNIWINYPFYSVSGYKLEMERGTDGDDFLVDGSESGDAIKPSYAEIDALIRKGTLEQADADSALWLRDVALFKNTAIRKLDGGAGNDEIVGDARSEFLVGGLGRDTLVGGGGTDTLMGGEGDDLYVGDKNTRNIVLNDTQGLNKIVLTGLKFANVSFAYNRSYLGNWQDSTSGGLGVNLEVKDLSGQNILTIANWLRYYELWHELISVDEIYSGADFSFQFDDRLISAEEIFESLETGANDSDNTIISSKAGRPYIVHGYGGNDSLFGGLDAQQIDGGAGADRIYLTGVAQSIARGGEGGDAISVQPGPLAVGQVLQGDAGDDSILGADGADTLDGGVGDDTLIGGGGRDVVYFRRGDGFDHVAQPVKGGQLILQFKDDGHGAITDTDVAVSRVGDDSLLVRLVGTGDAILLEGYVWYDSLHGRYIGDRLDIGFTDGAIWSSGKHDGIPITGTDGADVLRAPPNGSRVRGLAGNDVIYGSPNSDTLDGGAGDDVMYGGGGANLFYVDSLGDRVNGSGHVICSTNYFEFSGGLLEFVGNSNNYGIGSNIVSLSGSDTLVGFAYGIAPNVLNGGAGDDTYKIWKKSDTIIEAVDGGVDSVICAALNFTLPENVENISLVEDDYIDQDGYINIYSTWGNASNNHIIGNIQINIIDGGVGADTMEGGAGPDYYYVDNLGDRVVERPGEGRDVVYSSVDFALDESVEELTLLSAAIQARGNQSDNYMIGNQAHNMMYGLGGDDYMCGMAGNDVLDGGAGTDRLLGGSGDDLYLVDNTFDSIYEESTDMDSDSVVSSASSYILPEYVENIELKAGASGALEATGNSGANVMSGNEYSNRLLGYEGNDILDGGAGIDTLVGGLGDDVYWVDTAADSVVEATAEGRDQVFMFGALDYVLAANVESGSAQYSEDGVTLSGNADANALTGSRFDDVLRGNAGADFIKGGSGNDSLYGGAGDDLMNGQRGDDWLVDTSSSSNDLYVWGSGQGSDVVIDVGGTDRLSVLSGVGADQLWLRQVDSDLELSVIGLSDTFTVANWFGSTAYRLETFELADHRTLSGSKVQQMVEAMAVFAPPSAGQTSLPANYRDALGAVIAANWT